MSFKNHTPKTVTDSSGNETKKTGKKTTADPLAFPPGDIYVGGREHARLLVEECEKEVCTEASGGDTRIVLTGDAAKWYNGRDVGESEGTDE